MKLRIGTRISIDVRDFAQASDVYCNARDESGEGFSTFPDGIIKVGSVYWRISYNGKVWKGREYVASATPVYDPSAKVAS